MRWYGTGEGVMIYVPEVGQQSEAMAQSLVSEALQMGTSDAVVDGDVDEDFEELCDVEESTVVGLTSTRESLSQLSIVKDENFEDMQDVDDYDVIPSTETVKEEPNGFDFEEMDASATLTIPSSLSSQLEAFARSPVRVPSEQPSVSSSPVVVTPTSSLHVGNTPNSRETEESPSLRRAQVNRRDDTGRSRRNRIRRSSTPPVNRTLNFTTPASHRTRRVQRENSEDLFSLDTLSSIEKSPPHKWSEAERELLCVLYRYYKADSPNAIPKVFNAMTGLNLRHRTIQTQFDNLRLYGPQAYRSFRKVFASPFGDDKGRYSFLHAHIQSAAGEMGVRLQRRRNESRIRSGMAEFSQSEIIQRQYEARVRIVSQEEREAAANNEASKIPLDDWEVLTDIEETPSITFEVVPRVSKPIRSGNHLAFRVWCDGASATIFKNGGFIANLFAKRHNPVTRALPLDDVYGLFEVLANSHLSFQGEASTFVSVVTSLLQLLCYAGKKQGDDVSLTDIRIAVVDLNAPELNTDHKKHHAFDVIKTLQAKGEMSWTRYKGECEYLIWGDIPRTAIIKTLTMADIEFLCNKSRSSSELINLEYFTERASTRTVGERLQKENITLDDRTAKAMGKIAKVFGLSSKKATAIHITEFVTAQVSGWSITGVPLTDKHAIGNLAAIFALSLGQSSGMSLEKIMVAFVNGVERGSEVVAQYSRSSRRKRGTLAEED